MTIEDESIEDYIPARTEEGMREILLACLQKEPGKCPWKHEMLLNDGMLVLLTIITYYREASTG